MKDIKDELEKGKRYHAASKEEKRMLEPKLYKEEITNNTNKPGEDIGKKLDNIAKNISEKFKSIKLPEKKIKKPTSEMSREELLQELKKAKFHAITPKMWLGGLIGMFIYSIVKLIGGYGWWGGDVIGLILLGVVPGMVFIGSWLEQNF